MNKKKLLTLLLAAAALISLAAISVTKENGSGKEISSASNRDETIVLLHTNDVHGAIGHYAEVAALKSRYESEGA